MSLGKVVAQLKQREAVTAVNAKLLLETMDKLAAILNVGTLVRVTTDAGALQCSLGDHRDSAAGAKAEVTVLEPMGSETQLFARLGGQRIVGIFRERLKLQPGDTVGLKPDANCVHLFDGASGQRL